MIFSFVTFALILCISNPIVVLSAADDDNQHQQAENLDKMNSCHDELEWETDKYARHKNVHPTETSIDDFQSQIEPFNGEKVRVFQGVRYAKPPVGELRFAKPVPMDSDTVEMYGLQSAERVACVQPKSFLVDESVTVKEDCLHLNIWMPLPKRSTNNFNSNQLPVMIWIHGGSFHLGTANQDDYNGIVLSAIGQVIVVTMNYRLGFFGFLNAELESAPGNMGLYDQVAAITWVKENINKFGGDPENLTVFGESAGGLSVGLLTVSPLSNRLFHQAIIQSGSPYSPIRPEPKAKVFAKSLVFSKAISCSHPNDVEFTESAINCLRTVDYKVIDAYGGKEQMHSQILANPMFGDALIPNNVHELMKDRNNFNPKLKVLIGMNEHEGFAFIFPQLHHLIDSPVSQNVTRDGVHSLVGKLLKGRPVDPLQLTNYYFQNMTSEWTSWKVFNTIANLYGDVYINCPVHYLAKTFTHYLGYESVFSYVLTEGSSRAFMPACKDRNEVCHGDDLVLIFGVPLRNPKLFDEKDAALSKHLVGLWTNFARTGKMSWNNSHNNWFVDVPLAKVPKFHPERTYACDVLFKHFFN